MVIMQFQQTLQLVFCLVANVLLWCAILPVQPPLLPVWTHHVSDHRLGYIRRDEPNEGTRTGDTEQDY